MVGRNNLSSFVVRPAIGSVGSFEQEQRVVVVERVRQEVGFPDDSQDPDVHFPLVQRFPEVPLQPGRYHPDSALVAVGRPDVQHELEFFRAVRQHAIRETKNKKFYPFYVARGNVTNWIPKIAVVSLQIQFSTLRYGHFLVNDGFQTFFGRCRLFIISNY